MEKELIRQPAAPHFYRGDLKQQIDSFLQGFQLPVAPAKPVAGIVPHAGWAYSGKIAAQVIACFRELAPETFVIFGAVHEAGAKDGAVFDDGYWETPLGNVQADSQLAKHLIKHGHRLLRADQSAHAHEHSIEVQVPMIKHLYPKAKIVPIAIGMTDDAAEIGEAIGDALDELNRPVAILGSSDLTHYGLGYGFTMWGTGPDAYKRMYQSDQRMIDIMLAMKAGAAVPEATAYENACGPGAIDATIAAALAMGANTSHLVAHTTSHDVMGEGPDSFEMAVGYAGVVYGM